MPYAYELQSILQNAVWSPYECDMLLEAVTQHGKDWAAVEDFVGTKTQTEIMNKCNELKKKMKKKLDFKYADKWQVLFRLESQNKRA